MAGNNEFFEALTMLEHERGITAEYLIEKIRAAIVIAVKKNYDVEDDNVSVEIDPAAGVFNVALVQDVVADEDWMTAVMAAPTSTPKNRLAVSRSRICFIRLPAAASRPELIICMPYRNRAKPPNRLKKSVICIRLESSSFSLVSGNYLLLLFRVCGKNIKRHSPRARRSAGSAGYASIVR